MRAASGHWRARAATIEAMAWLVLSRTLVRTVRFGRWRRALGRPVPPIAIEPVVPLAENLPARRLARAVGRAAAQLPGDSRCLPQAMALSWLLRRRGLDCTIVIGVRAGASQGRIDDLHAWAVRHREVLIGASDAAHIPLIALA